MCRACSGIHSGERNKAVLCLHVVHDIIGPQTRARRSAVYAVWSGECSTEGLLEKVLEEQFEEGAGSQQKEMYGVEAHTAGTVSTEMIHPK